MHSQADHELHTSGGEEGRGQRRGTRQAFLRQPRSGAQGSTLQQTGYARKYIHYNATQEIQVNAYTPGLLVVAKKICHAHAQYTCSLLISELSGT
jgi:hypothetical protein